MIKVVIDTNLFVSYYLTQGPTLSSIFAHWEIGRFSVLMSSDILQEIKDVIHRPKLRKLMKSDPAALIELIELDSEFVDGAVNLQGVCRDPKDDKFLSCAVEGKAIFIVTGDQDLLVLDPFRGIQIVRPSQFVALISDA